MALFQKKEQNSENYLDLWTDEKHVPESTPMRDYYRDKVIFLTGGTGFLGCIFAVSENYDSYLDNWLSVAHGHIQIYVSIVFGF